MGSGRFAQGGVGLRRVEEGIEEHPPVSCIEHETFVFCDEMARRIERAVDHKARDGRILKGGRALDQALGRRCDADLDPLGSVVLDIGHNGALQCRSSALNCTPKWHTPLCRFPTRHDPIAAHRALGEKARVAIARGRRGGGQGRCSSTWPRTWQAQATSRFVTSGASRCAPGGLGSGGIRAPGRRRRGPRGMGCISGRAGRFAAG